MRIVAMLVSGIIPENQALRSAGYPFSMRNSTCAILQTAMRRGGSGLSPWRSFRAGTG